MKVINQDCLEIASILKAKYGGAETKANRSSEYVLDKIAEPIDDAYLVTRVAQFAEYTQTHWKHKWKSPTFLPYGKNTCSLPGYTYCRINPVPEKSLPKDRKIKSKFSRRK